MRMEAIATGDIGGSGGRVAALLRGSGGYSFRVLHEFAHPCHVFRIRKGDGDICRRYWNPFLIYEGLCQGLRRLARDGDADLSSFGVDSWGADGVWLSRHGDPLTPLINAYDDLWTAAREEVEELMPGRERFRLTGTYPDKFLVVTQIYWAARHGRDLVDAAEVFLPHPALYQYWFSGEKALECTWGTTGHLGSCKTRSYCEETFARLGLPREKMPAFVQPGAALGETPASLAGDLGHRPFAVMAAPNHDTACAFAVAPVREDVTSLVISAGTWWCMGALLPEPLITDAVYDAGFSNVAGVRGVILNIINTGAFPAQALRGQWEREDGRSMDWDAFNALAASGHRPDLHFDIDDRRLVVPDNMAETVVEVAGRAAAGDGRDRGRLAALLYMGLARKATRTAGVLGTLLGRPVEEIVVIGGGANNSLLNQWLADVSGLPVRTGAAYATAMGNALVQACSLGWFSSLEEGREALKGLWNERVFLPRHTG